MLGRYAPSPSGHMHLGNARTALLAWLQARAAGGQIALRIEDLDRDRCKPEWEGTLRDNLAWLGLDWDMEQQRQSERGAVYDAALDRLAAAGVVYECFCTRAEVRAASAPHGPEPIYPGTCRDLSEADRRARRAAGRRAALRLRVEPEVLAFDDLVHGHVEQDVAATGDFVVRRADGLHAYQLAVVVDDGAIGVTHVLRGDDLLSSTPRQMLLQRLLGLPSPVYAHVPLMRAPTGERLAKRHGSATLQSLRAAGSTPEQVVGELAASLGLATGGEHVAASALIPYFALPQ
jgi:glutamyl-tRNA synthetase